MGSFAWIHLPSSDLERAREALTPLEGIEEIYSREEAAMIFEHPRDRIGDLSITADAQTALGKSKQKHDLSALGETPLRSHGGRHEQLVPIIISAALREPYATRHAAGAPTADIHDVILNGAA